MVNKERVDKPIPQLSESEMSEEEIDRNLAETFPASDPPSWTLGTDHREESPNDQRDAEKDAEAE